MTRLAAALTAALLAFSVSACGTGDEPASTAPGTATSSTSTDETTAPAAERPDPTGAVDLVVLWTQAITDGDGPEACGYQTRAFTRSMIRETVNQGFAAPGSSCEEIVTTMSGILKSFGATGKPVVRLLSVNDAGDRATVTIGLSNGVPSDAYGLVYDDDQWILNADVSDKVLKK